MSNRGWFPLQDRRRPTLEPVQPAPDQDPLAIPVSPAVPESPGSPDGSAYSPTDTPTKRTTPSPPSYSPNRLACEGSLYVARQDDQFALPDCPDNRTPRPLGPPYSAVNPPLQPAPEPHRARVRRRRAPSPPRPVGRGRGGPYLRPDIPSEDSAFGPQQAPRTPSPPLLEIPPSRSPSPDILLELYQNSRHPVDKRYHLTILPSWSRKAPKEKGECVICYG